jgi:hypothetical protein
MEEYIAGGWAGIASLIFCYLIVATFVYAIQQDYKSKKK